MTSHPSPIPVRSIVDSSKSRWFVLQPVGLMASVGMTALLLGISLPAGATGFLDGDLSSWSGASTCSVPPSNCVDGLGGNAYDVFGSSSNGSSYVITSQQAAVAQAISFKYSFDGLGGLASFKYSVDSGNTYQDLASTGEGQFAEVYNVPLDTGKSVQFELSNNGTDPIATVSDLKGVPAPLPVLGAGATFGWIRRRRAQLKGHQSFHL
jgi:hypothetical protein